MTFTLDLSTPGRCPCETRAEHDEQGIGVNFLDSVLVCRVLDGSLQRVQCMVSVTSCTRSNWKCRKMRVTGLPEGTTFISLPDQTIEKLNNGMVTSLNMLHPSLQPNQSEVNNALPQLREAFEENEQHRQSVLTRQAVSYFFDLT